MSRLEELLQGDYIAAKEELALLDERQKALRWQLKYIETLLASANAPTKEGEATVPSPEKSFKGMTIADIAARILWKENHPLSAMEIAKRAMDGGFVAENIERARSHFSAIISKDINSAKPRFWQVDRGAIGLASWRKREEKNQEGVTPPPKVPDVVQFTDDDIPF